MSPSSPSPLPLEEVVEADFVERGRRGERRDVAADAVFGLVGLDHHRHRVPAHEALDPALDFAAARERRLLGRRDGVDVGRVGQIGKGNLTPPRPGGAPKRPSSRASPARPPHYRGEVRQFEPFTVSKPLILGPLIRSLIPKNYPYSNIPPPKKETDFTSTFEAFG